MAGDYLRAHGIDLDATLSEIQLGTTPRNQAQSSSAARERQQNVVSLIMNARMPGKDPSVLWSLEVSNGIITSVYQQSGSGPNISQLPGVMDAQRKLCVPSFCHAHIHLDKCFILEDEKFSDLEIVNGDFDEAMALTGKAKARFEEDDLLRRGRRLIRESIESGVTAMRAFVEVDEVVELKAVKAGLKLKKEFKEYCHVQICAFAQLALFTAEDGGIRRRQLMEEALALAGVDVLGSTPYVEDTREKMKLNVDWAIQKAILYRKQLDFHLDYNLDSGLAPLIWYVLDALRVHDWQGQSLPGSTICLGHCSRLTLFNAQDWKKLKDEIGQLPVHFVGLPKSDLFMMARPNLEDGGGQRLRGTLQITQMIKDYSLNGAISINNVGNAFTPQCSVEPLDLAAFGVAMYQAATTKDMALLLECVSTRAKRAIGLATSENLEIECDKPADIVFLEASIPSEKTSSVIARHVLGSSSSSVSPTLFRGRIVAQS